MKEVPEYEKYPISEEEMGKRYKNWTESLARQMVVLYKVGKEVGGEKFVERLKEEYRKDGKKGAAMWMSLTGSKPEDFKDCLGLPKVHDLIDDTFANFWNGYIENTPKAFEKELNTCPVTKQWSKAPELCEILLGESLKGMAEALNPKFKTKGFSKLLTKGDKCCRFRVEMGDD
ncbi:MAG: hypothetical protein PHO26_04445 [Dehalococcoidia bacterium]|nr:hypothetical protein [Dehalococcoidia bacterium]MDD5493874.1 hypothetical protein [Dehalococcoidia bacterium]